MKLEARLLFISVFSAAFISVLLENTEIKNGLLEIEMSDEWPYVGQEVAMSCMFYTNERDKYDLSWKYPTGLKVSSL